MESIQKLTKATKGHDLGDATNELIKNEIETISDLIKSHITNSKKLQERGLNSVEKKLSQIKKTASRKSPVSKFRSTVRPSSPRVTKGVMPTLGVHGDRAEDANISKKRFN